MKVADLNRSARGKEVISPLKVASERELKLLLFTRCIEVKMQPAVDQRGV